jgi:hypothetical protein
VVVLGSSSCSHSGIARIRRLLLRTENLAWFNSSTVGVAIGGCPVGNALRGVPLCPERHGVRSLQNSAGELLPRFEPGRKLHTDRAYYSVRIKQPPYKRQLEIFPIFVEKFPSARISWRPAGALMPLCREAMLGPGVHTARGCRCLV